MTKTRKKILWQVALVLGLLAEIALIVLAVASLVFSGHDLSETFQGWQVIAFMAIAVWIYIAYLKQRSVDISKHVVDEKIKTHSLVQHLREGIIVVDSQNCILTLNDRAAGITGLNSLDVLGQDLADMGGEAFKDLLLSSQSGEKEGLLTRTGRCVRLSVIQLHEGRGAEGNKIIYVYAPKASSVSQPVPTAPAGNLRRVQGAERVIKMAAALQQAAAQDGAPEMQAAWARLAVEGLTIGICMQSAVLAECASTGRIKATLKSGKVGASAIITQVVKDLAPFAAAALVKIEMVPIAADLVISGDERVLSLALKEILCHAILATPPGGKAIQIRSAPMGVNLGIAVLDRGPAILADAMDCLFRVPYEGVSGLSGTLVRDGGCGLFLAREVVEAHDGTLVASNHVEGGLSVTMMLPLAQ